MDISGIKVDITGRGDITGIKLVITWIKVGISWIKVDISGI